MHNVMHQTEVVVDSKSLSIPHSIAQCYYFDALDFAERFDILWEHPLNKTGRVKRLLDLIMGCECILKAHIFLGFINNDPKETYKNIRKAGHRIDNLADLACFSSDRTNYDFLKSELQPFSVLLRYSLDAYDTFFPMLDDWQNADINYSDTIGNQPWVMSIRQHLNSLTQELSDKFGGCANQGISEIHAHAEQMKAFMKDVKK